MKYGHFKKSLLLGLALVFIATALPITTNAAPERVEKSERSEKAQTAKQDRQEKSEAAETIVEDKAVSKKAANQTKLVDNKLKACEKREKNITRIMAKASERGQKQIDTFTKIAERTQAFYASKGKTLTNYDALVADVTAKKAAAQAAVDTTKATAVEFKCDGTDPKGAAASFKEGVKTQNAALKAYKTAVKNLIVGVKSVQSTTKSGDDISTPTPTAPTTTDPTSTGEQQ